MAGENPYSKPITIFALMQVGVVLLGIAAAGIVRRMFIYEWGMEPPDTTAFLFNRGILLMIVPLAWAGLSLYGTNREDSTDWIKVLVVVTGVMVLMFLAGFCFRNTFGYLVTGGTRGMI